jgi:hypothetical protein
VGPRVCLDVVARSRNPAPAGNLSPVAQSVDMEKLLKPQYQTLKMNVKNVQKKVKDTKLKEDGLHRTLTMYVQTK